MAMNDDLTYPFASDIPLYAEAKLTRQEAINEIGDVIFRSDMKPQVVQSMLQLIQKFLPVENTLPTTMEELFAAMNSSEDNVRLTLYFIKHGHYPSFLTSSTHLPNETTSITMVQTDSSAIEEQESQSPVYPTCECCQHNADELSSDSNEENELSPYDRLQQCLQPISDVNPPTALSGHYDDDDEERRFLHLWRMFDYFTDDTDEEYSSNDRKPLSCFEINGRDLLNGGKRRRY